MGFPTGEDQDESSIQLFLGKSPVESHHPVVRVLLVLCGKQDAVALPHRVEEKLPAFQIYKGGVQQEDQERGNFPGKARKKGKQVSKSHRKLVNIELQ